MGTPQHIAGNPASEEWMMSMSEQLQNMSIDALEQHLRSLGINVNVGQQNYTKHQLVGMMLEILISNGDGSRSEAVSLQTGGPPGFAEGPRRPPGFTDRPKTYE